MKEAPSYSVEPQALGGGSTIRLDRYLQALNSVLDELGWKEGTRLKQTLRARHSLMIAIGGTLGTGLLMGSGVLLLTGPGLVFVLYLIVAAVVHSVMTALGEISLFVPLNGYANYCKRYVDDALGFAIGVVIAIRYLVLPAAGLVGAAMAMSFWVPTLKVNPGVWIAVFLVFITCINMLTVRWYGEWEFCISCLKITLAIILIIILFCISMGATGHRIGFRYWRDPGAFKEYMTVSDGKLVLIPGAWGRFVAFFSTFMNAVYSYMGCELVAIAFAELKHPRRDIPRVINLTFWRIFILYTFLLLMLGMTLSPHDTNLLADVFGLAYTLHFPEHAGIDYDPVLPFVIAVRNAEVPGLAHFINTMVLIFSVSIANTDIYVSLRTIYLVAVAGYIPQVFCRTNKLGVPYFGVAVLVFFTGIAFMACNQDSHRVFNYLANVVLLTGLITWWSIFVIHIRFMRAIKKQGYTRENLGFRAPLQPYSLWAGVVVCLVLTVFKNFTDFIPHADWPNIISGYIVLPVFVVSLVGYKLYFRTQVHRSQDIDLDTFRDIIEELAAHLDEQSAIRKAAENTYGRHAWRWWYHNIIGWIF